MTLQVSTGGASAREAPHRLRNVLLLGDFSGRASRGVCEPDTIGQRRPRPVDSEDLDEVLARLSPEISVPLTENPSVFRPRALEDFHPDRVFAREPAFAELRRAREGLERTETFQDAAAIVKGWGQIGRISGSVRRRTRPPEPWRPPTAFTGPPDLLAQMLESHSKRVTRDAGEFEELDVFVESIVRPHVAPADEEERQPLIAEADRVTSTWMRTVLHDPGFQAAESAWRGLDFLLRRIGSDVRVFLLDVTREELAQDLRRGSSVSDSGLHRLLAARDGHVPGDGGWSVLAGIYAFSPAVSDVALLARLGRIAQAAGAPFVAAAAPELLAADSFASPPDPRKWESSGDPAEEIWKALRQMSEARFLGLAAPGFLLRLPYGAASDPTERFSFEESPGEPPHGDYLWGNPVFLVLARVAGEAEIGGLPLHVFQVEGEKRLRPCAETLLPSRVAEAMLGRGVMPVVGFAGRDAVRLLRLQSIADPPAPLALEGK